MLISTPTGTGTCEWRHPLLSALLCLCGRGDLARCSLWSVPCIALGRFTHSRPAGAVSAPHWPCAMGAEIAYKSVISGTYPLASLALMSAQIAEHAENSTIAIEELLRQPL